MTPARGIAGGLRSRWWPGRPVRVPSARIAGLLACLGAVLFGTAALALAAGATSWDARLFHALNEVPPAVAAVLTPLSALFRPAGIVAVVLLAIGYIVARNRSVLPVAAGALAAGLGWALAHMAKAVADRPRPYDTVAGAVLRQQPAHGTSFPSSHTAITLAVVIALVPFLARPIAIAGIGYAIGVGWSRIYLGVHYPLDVLGGAGIGAAAGGLVLLALGVLLHRMRPAAGAQPVADAQAHEEHPGPGGGQEQ
jgi:undecaprenyl-diphosphatase